MSLRRIESSLRCRQKKQTRRRQTMQKTENRITQKCHHVSALVSACRHRRPKTFMPFIAGIAPNSLRHHPIHNQRANLTLRIVVRRTNHRRIIDEQEITFAMFLETLRNRQRLLVLRNKSPNRLLNRRFMTVQQTFEANLRQFGLPMMSRKYSLSVR